MSRGNQTFQRAWASGGRGTGRSLHHAARPIAQDDLRGELMASLPWTAIRSGRRRTKHRMATGPASPGTHTHTRTHTHTHTHTHTAVRSSFMNHECGFFSVAKPIIFKIHSSASSNKHMVVWLPVGTNSVAQLLCNSTCDKSHPKTRAVGPIHSWRQTDRQADRLSVRRNKKKR